MCGIVGIIGEKSNKENIQKMNDKIIHRGPDDEGYFVVEGEIALGMRRLSIIDLSLGHQPMTDASSNKTIIFNGEIYNYKELRDELIRQDNVEFKTNSDTEVILKLYEIKGEECVKYLRGMFAFAIYDKKTKSVFVARDHFGIKPLYIYKVENKIQAFASEIKSILEIPDFKKEINLHIIPTYLRFQYNPFKETFFKGIYKVMPGTCLKINADGSYVENSYFEPEFRRKRYDSFLDAKEKVKSVVVDSVSHHMIADVEVGSFLSGGVDSSIIASLAQRELKKNKLKTFTVGFSEFSENKTALLTAQKYKTEHKEIVINSKDFFQELPKAMWHFDEPVADASAMGLYFLSKEASKNVKVVLSGEGSDEFFAGYEVYRSALYKELLENHLPDIILKPIYLVLNLLVNAKINFYGKQFVSRLVNGPSWYIGNASVFTKTEIEKYCKVNSGIFDVSNIYKATQDSSDSEKMQMVDIKNWLVGDILQKADKMSMAHSLEVRVPFLDKDVFDIALNLPERFKLRNFTTKYILRRAFRGVVPKKTAFKKKLGFPIPIKTWLRDFRISKIIKEKINSSDFIMNQFDMHYANKLIDEHFNGSKDNSRRIYALYCLAIWHEQFFK